MPRHAYISLSPSSASRWMSCTASPGYIARNKDKVRKREDDFTSEGEDAHNHLENAVNAMIDFDLSAEDAIESLNIEDFVTKSEVLEAAKFFHDKVKEDDVLTIEAKIPIWYKKDQNGYVDYLYLSPTGIKIWDFKYGSGMAVHARNNLQLAIYAVSVYEAYGDVYGWDEKTLITLGIYQPRIQSSGKPFSLWAPSIGELKSFVEDCENAAKEIQANPAGGYFRPSQKACQFCPAKEFCVAKAKDLTEALPTDIDLVDFDNPEENTHDELAEYAVSSLPSVDTLTPQQISAVLTVRTRLTKWMNELNDYAKERLEDGDDIPGFKLVEGHGRRTWKSEETAEQLLGNQLSKDERMPRTLLSVAQAEKALKGKKLSTRFTNRFEECITKTSGKITIAPESDKRQAIGPQALGFESLDPEGETQPENVTSNDKNEN